MNEVVHHYPAARLVIAGGGPMEGHLKDMVYRNGLGKIVEFVGHG